MTKLIQPTYSIKLNSEFVDEIVFNEALDSDKIILQQFDDELATVYVCLNGSQVKVDMDNLRDSINLLHTNRMRKESLTLQQNNEY